MLIPYWKSFFTNSSAPSINTTLWHYLDIKIFNFKCENNITPGALIEEIRYAQIVLTLECDCGLGGKGGTDNWSSTIFITGVSITGDF